MKNIKKIFCLISFLVISFFVVSCGPAPEANFGELPAVINVDEEATLDWEVLNAVAELELTSSSACVAVDGNTIKAVSVGTATLTAKLTCDDKNATVFTQEYTVQVVENRKVTVTFDAQGGTVEKASAEVGYGQDFTSFPTASKEHYTFKGWSTDAEGKNMVTKLEALTSNAKVYAQYEAIMFAVSYELDGGSYEGVETVQEGTKVTLGTPEKDDYDFLGWSLTEGSTEYVTEITVSADTTVYANWKQKIHYYDVRFYIGEKELTDLAFTHIEEGSTVSIAEKEATKDHFDFVGWALEEDSTDFIEGEIVVNEDIELYAIFTPSTYSITYELSGGILYSYQAKGAYGTSVALPTPSKTGAKFLGWSLSAGGSIITEVQIQGPTTVYANWEEYQYTITYELNGGLLATPGKATITISETYDLPTPTKDGSTFLGWTDSPISKAYITQLANVTANTKLYANWTDGAVATPATLESVLAGAEDGDVIILQAGQYHGITINKAIKLQGPNAAVNPNTAKRGAEAVFDDVIVVKANGVVIDGIALNGYGTVAVHGAENVKVTNVLCYETLNGSGNISYQAPVIAFGAKNLAVTNCRWEKSTAGDSNRNMIFYGYNLEGLTITHNEFYGNLANYNDGIKIANGQEGGYDAIYEAYSFGIKGKVVVSHNSFDGFQQYPIWLRSCQDVEVEVEDNTISNSYAADSTLRGLLTLVAASGTMSIKFNYNHIIKAQTVMRIDAAPSGATLEYSHNIVEEVNGTYDKVPTFASVTCENNYNGSGKASVVTDTAPAASAAEVETYAQNNSKQYNITYDLAGGKWPVGFYDPAELGELFLADYNPKCSIKTATADKLDTAFTDSGAFATACEAIKGTWGWLYAALWEAAEAADSKNPSTHAITDYDVKSFLISQLCGFFTKSQHKDTNFGTESIDYSDALLWRAIAAKGPSKGVQVGPVTYMSFVETVTPVPTKEGLSFAGWMTDDGQTFVNIPATIEGDLNLTALWDEKHAPELVQLNNFPTAGIKLYQSLQLEWLVSPSNAYDKEVFFRSSDSTVFTINDKGYIYANSNGTAKLIITLAANPDYKLELDVTVFAGDYFDVAYKTESYCYVDETLELEAVYYDELGQACRVTWESLTPEIATVSYGKVTALKEGQAVIRAKYDETHYFDFGITVFGEDLSDILQFVVDNHDSNPLLSYNLNVSYDYYYDVIGSVNKILLNDPLKVDKRYYNKVADGVKDNGHMETVEFVTVHYTGNPAPTSDADNNADYFNNLGYAASIHYVTGRTNLTDLTGQKSGWNKDAYYAFADMREDRAAWHASDSGQGQHTWTATGVKYKEGDPAKAVVTISKNAKFEINGQETTVAIPALPSGATLEQVGINQQGIACKVENGEYYIGNTWWGSQVSPSREDGKVAVLTNIGGNYNSIGIESDCSKGSDLMHTWHVTAQLVADILNRHDLDITRVYGHYGFSGKDCPQPLLANKMQIWDYFIECVEAELALLQEYEGAEISVEILNGAEVARTNGLLVQDASSHLVTYKVTVTFGGKTESVTLHTCVESFYCCRCERTEPSLQNQGIEII